jgi:hypothetical protein
MICVDMSVPAILQLRKPRTLSRESPIWVGPLRWSLNNMCRNIKPLFNFDPPVTEDEIRAASLQFVRKISGFNKPSKANEAAFLTAIDEINAASARLLAVLETNAPARNREEEAAKARLRNAQRFPGNVTP